MSIQIKVRDVDFNDEITNKFYEELYFGKWKNKIWDECYVEIETSTE